MDNEKRKQPTPNTIKRLFALSSNQCAFPECRAPLIDPKYDVLSAQISHIKGEAPGSARYDPAQSEDERRDFENLLLLCPRCHAIIDARPDIFTVERLRGMKATHEAQARRIDLALLTRERIVELLKIDATRIVQVYRDGKRFQFQLGEIGKPELLSKYESERIDILREIAIEIISVKEKPDLSSRTDKFSCDKKNVKIIQLMMQVPDVTIKELLTFMVSRE